MKKINILCACIAAAAVVSIPGCYSKPVIKTDIVQGTITMNGTPLAGAAVTFSPAGSSSGNVAVGTSDTNGQYKLQTLLGKVDAGTTPGDYIVTVSKRENIPTDKQEKSEYEDKMVDIVQEKEFVPSKFTNKKTSPLKAAVVAGQINTFDFDVSK